MCTAIFLLALPKGYGMLKKAWRWLFVLAIAGMGEKETKRRRQFKTYPPAAFSSAKSCYAANILRRYPNIIRHIVFCFIYVDLLF